MASESRDPVEDNKKSKVPWIILACAMGLALVIGAGVIIANALGSFSNLERAIHGDRKSVV